MSDEKDVAIGIAAADAFLAKAVKITGVRNVVTDKKAAPEDETQTPPKLPDIKPE